MYLGLEEAKILLVDDEVSNTALMEDVLRFAGFHSIRSLNDSRGVLSLFIEFQPDMVISDLRMPHLNGFQVLEILRYAVGEKTYLPILIVTADANIESRRRALSSGAIDFITRPFLPDEIVLRVTNLLRIRLQQRQLQQDTRALEDVLLERTRELENYQLELREAQIEVIQRLARAAEYHDDETGQHTQRVGLTCSLLAQNLGIPESRITLMRRAAPLHDVGKIGISDTILLKPGKFTERERELMQAHSRIGADLLAGGHSELMQIAEQLALTHHERWDGLGYPRGLCGEDIPLEGRLLAVADVFDALTHIRPYKEAWPLDEAVTEIRRQSGQHFDPAVVDAFLTLPHADLI